MTLKELKAKLELAKTDYHNSAHLLAPSQAAEKSAEIKSLMRAISSLIAEGAKPCCGSVPHGMEQPNPKKDRPPEYQIGCLTCGRSVRGGMLPRHAVEYWNEGEDS